MAIAIDCTFFCFRRGNIKAPTSFKYPLDERTFRKHAEKARTVLGWRKFNGGLRASTQKWLDLEARRSDDPDYLQGLLEAHLYKEQIVPPALSSLERMVGQARAAAQDHIVKLIIKSLDKRQKAQVDKLRNTKRGTRRSHLQWTKDPPAFASPRTLRKILEQIEFVRSFGLPTEPFE